MRRPFTMRDHIRELQQWRDDDQIVIARLRAQLAEAEAERDRDCAEMRRFQAEWRKMLDDVTAADARLAASESKRKLLARVVRTVARQKLPDEVTEDERESADYEGAYECMVREARAATDAANALEEPR